MNFSKILQASAMSLVIASLVAACAPGSRKSSKRPSMKRAVTEKANPLADKIQKDRESLVISEKLAIQNAEIELMKAIEDVQVKADGIIVTFVNKDSVIFEKDGTDNKQFSTVIDDQKYVIKINDSADERFNMLLARNSFDKAHPAVRINVNSNPKLAVVGIENIDEMSADARKEAERVQTALTTNVIERTLDLSTASKDKTMQRRTIVAKDESFTIQAVKFGTRTQVRLEGIANAEATLQSTATPDVVTLVLELKDEVEATLKITLKNAEAKVPAEEALVKESPTQEGELETVTVSATRISTDAVPEASALVDKAALKQDEFETVTITAPRMSAEETAQTPGKGPAKRFKRSK